MPCLFAAQKRLSLMQGLGFEVLAQLLESRSPSHVMQLTTPNPNNNLPHDRWWLPEGVPLQQGDPFVYQLPSVGALQQDMGLDPSGTLAGSTNLQHVLEVQFRLSEGPVDSVFGAADALYQFAYCMFSERLKPVSNSI